MGDFCFLSDWCHKLIGENIQAGNPGQTAAAKAALFDLMEPLMFYGCVLVIGVGGLCLIVLFIVVMCNKIPE